MIRVSRRQFTGGALGLALASRLSAQAAPTLAAPMRDALEAIRAYGETHLRAFGLPGMTLGLTTPAGLSTVLNFGYADPSTRSPIGPGTLFEIGSITKSMLAALLHAFAAEGRFSLNDRLTALLPSIPLPGGNAITVQELLDHTSGLPADAPVFPDGGLWTGFAPGSHWSYSNTGYDILGRLAERLGGTSLDQLLTGRILAPLGMTHSKGAIVSADRSQYAVGYQAADSASPFVIGTPLAPAPWIDVDFGAACVGSTADDMNRFLRSLASTAQGRGGLGLDAAQGLAFVRHSVPSDTPAMTYGNGLMHVAHGSRTYLHHTGGMVGFSSSFHLDPATGAGAFASCTLTGFAGYRPRLLTRFAVDALAEALRGRPLPSPPPIDFAAPRPHDYAGHYKGPDGMFEVRPTSPLTLVADGAEAMLQLWGADLFRTNHPRFRHFSLKFARVANQVIGADWGPSSFSRNGASRNLPPSDPALARLAGRFVNDSPWWGTLQLVERAGRLWIGTEVPMQLISTNLWRIGEEQWSPERGTFADFTGGRPQTFIFSGEKFARRDG